MANQFSVEVPNIYQALMAGQQGYDESQKANQQRALQEAGQLYANGDVKGALAAAAKGGSLQTLMGLSSLQNNDRDFAFRQQEAQRTQSNADRSFGLQQQAANNPNIQKDENGNFIIINKQGTGGRQLPIEGQTQNNPFSYGKMNENQGKDSGYANRMFQSESILRDPKLAEASKSIIDRAAEKVIPGDAATFITSDSYKKYDQAARDFVNATLRRESGAAISSSEFDNAYKQYLPRPNDPPELLLQKQKNRQATIASIAGGGGNNYKPPFSFGPNGEMVSTGNAQQGTTQKTQTSPTQVPERQAPIKITSAAERDSLQPGTSYIAPDGSLRTKQ